jgi:large subunit ribosomal protein L32
VAVPKRKKSKSRVAMRRAHHDIHAKPGVIACPNCKEPTLPHRVCPECGFYDGVQVVVKKEKTPGEAEAE